MKKIGALLLLTFAFAVLTGTLEDQLLRHGKTMNLSDDLIYSDKFRRMDLSDEALFALRDLEDSGHPKGRLLAVLLPWEDFSTPPKVSWDLDTFEEAYGELSSYRSTPLEHFLDATAAVWDDLMNFPVQSPVTYENSWMFERTFGGKRGHEGCDLMPPENRRDFYPIQSMTDGVVEKIGWLPKGGYRIGIRSFHEGYFYYAHLSSYAKNFQVGEAVSAGDILGYMGDTGYGEEGTMGKFDVHLHVGIYIAGKNGEEISVNPYWILRYLEG